MCSRFITHILFMSFSFELTSIAQGYEIPRIENADSVIVDWALTTHDCSHLLSEMPSFRLKPIESPRSNRSANSTAIFVNDSITYQSLYGIGSSMESSTAFNLMRVDETAREEILLKLFDEKEGIGFNLMRITIGTSDFCPLPFYSYDDGETDINLERFSTKEDEKFIVPAILEAIKKSRELNVQGSKADELFFFASPWSAPGWMKSSGQLEGGLLLSDYQESYANYLAKFIEAYAAYGIEIKAITPQNEPLANQTYPSVFLPPAEEAALIQKFLGEKMKNLGTEIWCFDHNWNTLFYPEIVLNASSGAAQYVSGTAFHGYRGQPSDMTTLHEKYPDKDIFFSEGSTFGLKGARRIVNIFRNFARSYSAWVTILDTELQPNAGPFKPQPTMIQVDSTTLEVIYNYEYYMYGQFSKFLRRGHLRIASTDDEPLSGSDGTLNVDDDGDLGHVAFIGKDGGIVLVVVNEAYTDSRLRIVWRNLDSDLVVPKRSVSTFRWKA